MKKKYISVFLFLLIINFLVFKSNAKQEDNFLAVMNEQNEIIHKNEISIKKPTTKYLKLNEIINKNILEIKNDFLKNITNVFAQEEFTYTLFINYEKEEYKNYLSYVFFIEIDTGGAHPNHNLWTVVYDTYQNKVVTIDSLIQNNPELLKTFSKISRANLLINPNISPAMMLDGTKPQKENFKNFVLTDLGLKILFSRYQVAPYVAGEFSVIIPYSTFKL